MKMQKSVICKEKFENKIVKKNKISRKIIL